jgi:hypothetical protein
MKMLPSAEAAQETQVQILANICLLLFVCVICLFISLSLSLSLALSLVFYSVLFYSVVLFVWIRTLDWLFRTTGCWCTVVGLTTAPSFAQEGGLVSKQAIFIPRMGDAFTESDGPCHACDSIR